MKIHWKLFPKEGTGSSANCLPEPKQRDDKAGKTNCGGAEHPGQGDLHLGGGGQGKFYLGGGQQPCQGGGGRGGVRHPPLPHQDGQFEELKIATVLKDNTYIVVPSNIMTKESTSTDYEWVIENCDTYCEGGGVVEIIIMYYFTAVLHWENWEKMGSQHKMYPTFEFPLATMLHSAAASSVTSPVIKPVITLFSGRDNINQSFTCT